MRKTVEIGARAVRKRTNIEHVLLHTIAMTGFLSVMLLAPNAMRVLSMFDGGMKRSKNPKYLFGTAFERLLGKRLITLEQTPKGKFVRLTDSGKYELALMIARNHDKRKHRRWDKRWRMVTYDIKEERRKTRKQLQALLKSFGFYKLQNSVWIYPYDTEALLILLKAHYKLGSEVIYGVLEKFENDTDARKHFSLS